MTSSQLETLGKEFFEQCLQIISKKGPEYSGLDDRLSNFKRNGLALGLKPTTTLLVYMSKHFDSVTNFVKRYEKERKLKVLEDSLSEPIQERLKDLSNYCLLLHALLHEERESR